MGKWGLWKFFSSVRSIRPFLPPTTLLTRSSLAAYLANYKAVYIKPTGGCQGRGVIRAWKTDSGYSFVRERGAPVACPSIDDLYRKIKPGGRSYIVQKAIRLAEVAGRPFDIRLMMMRGPDGKWQYVGMVAKVAGPGSVITNLGRGKGYVTEVETALRRSLGLRPQAIEAVKQQMIRLGYDTCRRFDDYKRYWQIGLDLAVDKRGNVWMIEENTGPAHFLFAKLRDKSTYRKIRQFAKAHWARGRRRVAAS